MRRGDRRIKESFPFAVVVGLRSRSYSYIHAPKTFLSERTRGLCSGKREVSKPPPHKAETPHTKMHSRLEACLAEPMHILFRRDGQGFILGQAPGPLDPF